MDTRFLFPANRGISRRRRIALRRSERVTVTRVSTDSRTIQPGDFFVPIRGENFDGHNFVEQVAERGAAGALVEEGWKGKVPKDFALLRVADTLGWLSANRRRLSPIAAA